MSGATVRVKLCGTACAEDLELACELGVDYVGFIFAESPRRVTIEQVGAWRADARRRGLSLPEFVGVFVNADLDELATAKRTAGLDRLQLHGDEPPSFCERAAAIAPIVKAVHLSGPESLPRLDDYASCWAALVEPRHPSKRGGAGVALALALAAGAARERRVFLAGGLRPDTVAEAVRAVRPFAVDVVSGVEARPGEKQRSLVERFVSEARAALNPEAG